MVAHRLRRLAALALITCFLAPALLHTVAIAAQTEGRAPVTITMGRDFRPFEFVDEQARPAGLMVDLWTLWSEKTGIPVSFEPVPWPKTLERLRGGGSDIHAGLNFTEERQGFLDYGPPLLSTDSYIFTPKGFDLGDQDNDLSGFRIGVLKASLEEAILRNEWPGVEIVSFDTIDALYSAVADRQIRLFADVEQTGLYFLGQHNLVSDYQFDTSRPLKTNHLFAAVRQGDKALLENVNRGMALITANERAQIARRWLRSAERGAVDSLVVAMPRDNPPLSLIDANGQPAGLLVDIWQLWSEKTGQALRFKPGSPVDNLAALQNGEADAHIGLFKTPEREEWIAFSQPLFDLNSGFYSAAGHRIPEDLSKHRVGTVFGHFHESHLRKVHPEATVSSRAHLNDLVHALNRAEVDALFALQLNVDSSLGRMGMRGRIVRTDHAPIRNALYFGVRRGETETLELLNSGLGRISQQELADIERRWIPNPADRFFVSTDLAVAPAQTANVATNQNVLKLSAEELAWIRANPKIRVHNESDWPPFNYAEGGHPLGYSIDYMNLLASRVGLEVEYITGPTWNEFMGMVREGELDVMLNIVKTRDRQEYLLYTPPYADNPNTIISRRDSPFDSLEQLKGKTVAIPKGFFYEEILSRDFPDINLLLMKNTFEGMKAVKFGNADAALGELAVFDYLMADHMMTDMAVSGEVKMGDPELSLLNIATRKELPVLASILTKAVKSVQPKDVRAIQEKWLGGRYADREAAPTLRLTDEEKAWLKEHPVLRLGMDPAYPPFEFIASDGKYVGISVDYMHLIGERLGVDVEVVEGLSWAEVLKGVQENRVDILPAASKTPERDVYLNFTQPHLIHPDAIITRDDFPFITGLSDLNDRTIAVVEGYSITETLAREYPRLKAVAYPTLLEALESVASGKTEATVANLAVATYVIRQNNIGNLKFAGTAQLNLPDLSIGVRKDWPELVGILDKVLASITEEEKQQIQNRWVSIEYEQPVDLSIIRWAAVAIGVIVLLIIIWNQRLRREVHERRKLQEVQRTLLEAVSLPIIVVQKATAEIRYINEAAAASSPENTCIGENANKLYANPADREDFLARMKSNGRVDGFEVEQIGAGPEPSWVLISSREIVFEDEPSFLTTWTDITSRKRATEELERARDVAEAAAKAKSEFIAVVSHEVRTPMNGVLGMARLLLETPLLPNQREFSRSIVESGEALLYILNDLLDISKLEAGKLDIEIAPFTPRSLIADTVNVMASNAREKQLELKLSLDDSVPDVLIGDGARVRQILFNLLSNAIKFTAQGSVTVSAHCSGDLAEGKPCHLSLSVKDTGVGIGPEEAERLFAPYVQANVDVARRFGGTGLGLSISRRLAELMNGQIHLESEPGKGSEFRLELDIEIGDEADSVALVRRAEEQQSSRSGKAPTGLRVLLVEDNLLNRKVALGMLAKIEAHTVVAENGQEALDELDRQADFDVVLMDRNMPVMDGIEATRRIRALGDERRNIPIIGLTAAATRHEIEFCLSSGMNDVVTKPVDPDQFEDALARLTPEREDSEAPNKRIDKPRPADEDDTPILNPAVLERLKEQQSEDALAEFIQDFREIGPDYLVHYEDAQEAGDLEAMTLYSHDLKSNAATLGLSRLSACCLAVELACKSEDRDEASRLATAIEPALTDALDALDAYAPDETPGDQNEQSAYLSKVTHELRGSMNRILGPIRWLQDATETPVSDTELEEFAGDIRQESLTLNSLAEDVLSLLQLEAGHYRLEPESIDVFRLAQETLRQVQSMCTTRELEFRLEAPPIPLTMQLDHHATRHAFTNLLINAGERSAEGDVIRVSLAIDAQWLTLRCIDQGQAFDPQSQSRMEENFGGFSSLPPGEADMARRWAVAQALAKQQQGRVALDSDTEAGHASTLLLPAAKVTP